MERQASFSGEQWPKKGLTGMMGKEACALLATLTCVALVLLPRCYSQGEEEIFNVCVSLWETHSKILNYHCTKSNSEAVSST